MKRLFAAIKIPTEPALEELVGTLQLKTKYDRINWVNLNNLHLTLNFFGETSEDRVEDICKQLEEATREGCPFTMQINKLGVFGSRYQPRVIWLGIQDHPDLQKLWRNTTENLKKIDIYPDRQNFVPHLTLGRVKEALDKKKFFGVIQDMQDSYRQTIHVKEFYLLNSTLTREGPVYDVVRKFEMKG